MKRRPFFGLLKPALHYTVLPDVSPGPVEEVPPSGKATFLVPGSLDSQDLMTLKVGDEVKAGQRLAPFAGSDAYAISSISGKVSAMEPYVDAFSRTFTAISVEGPTQSEWDEGFGESPDKETILKYLQNGPGGLDLSAFAEAGKNISSIVVMGMDKDVLVTAVQHVVKDKADQIAEGVKVLKKTFRASRIIMAVPSTLAKEAQASGCEVKEVDAVYPSASPKMVMHKILGQTVPAGQEPEDLGVVFMSAEAVAALGESCKTGKPAVHKIVTVIDKDENAFNVKVGIGAPIKDVLALKRIMINEGDRVILGGPMQGTAVYSADIPVQPDTDAIMVQDGDGLPEISDNACINCGDCVRVCPARIQVNMLVRLLENALYEDAADQYDLLSCIDCGLCSYVCTAQIPVFQYIGLAKNQLSRLASEAE